jgi:hypothetical protein
MSAKRDRKGIQELQISLDNLRLCGGALLTGKGQGPLTGRSGMV